MLLKRHETLVCWYLFFLLEPVFLFYHCIYILLLIILTFQFFFFHCLKILLTVPSLTSVI